MNKFNFKAQNYPESPGVYCMLQADGKTLYIGKALNLKKRLSQYFANKHDGRYQIDLLINEVNHIETIVTNSERDALILENQLIKRQRPKYNIRLKDDKTYPYIRLSTDTFPRIEISRERQNKDYSNFGPYTIVSVANHLIDFISTHYGIRRCPGIPLKKLEKPCLYEQIGQCSAPCVDKISKESYSDTVKIATKILNGDLKNIIKDAKIKMEEASLMMDYETAAKERDIWRALKNLNLEKPIEGGTHDSVDILSYTYYRDWIVLVILQIRNTTLWNKDIFQFRSMGPLYEQLQSFMLDYYQKRDCPKIIAIDDDPKPFDLVQKILNERSQIKIELKQPKRGELKSWMTMARQNVRAEISCRDLTGVFGPDPILRNVKRECELDVEPKTCIAMDAAIFGKEEPVVGVVVFKDGKPDKKSYRKFIIKENKLGDIYYIEEALTRWINRFYDEMKPDVFLIDGGSQQLSVCKDILNEFGIKNNNQLIAISKGDKRKSGEEILHFVTGKNLTIKDAPNAMKFFTEMRDEAHRLCNQFNTKRLIKSRLRSSYQKIPGIGPKTEQTLRKKFPSIQDLLKATKTDINNTQGINSKQKVILNHWIEANQ
jgi:excinuclease ABC subunit C